MGQEQDPSGKVERTAVIIRNAGVGILVVGLFISQAVAALGALTAVGGEIVRRSQKKGG